MNKRGELRNLAFFAKDWHEKRLKKGLHSRTHDWKEHVLPTARLAAKLATIAGGSKKEQELAFVAGLFHDALRLPERVLKKRGLFDRHEEESAKFAEKFLEKNGSLSQQEIKLVCEAIRTHSFGIGTSGTRKEGKPKNLVGIALKAADKYFQLDQNIVWRRNTFIGESAGFPLDESKALAYWEARLKKSKELLSGEEGKLLKKIFPRIKENLAALVAYVKQLRREMKFAKNPRLNEELCLIGALGIMRLCAQSGAKGKNAREAAMNYKSLLKKYLIEKDKRWKNFSAKEIAILRQALEISLKLVQQT